jgi:hypothetical protein
MSKRLQVVLDDEILDRYERAARSAQMTLSEWVRQSLGAAERQVSTGDADAKLAVVRAAARHTFPAPDVETMLEEIERGRGSSDE